MPEPPPSAELVLKAFADKAKENPSGRYMEQGIAASLRVAVNEEHEPEVPSWYVGDSYWTYQAGMNAMRNHVIATADAIDCRSISKRSIVNSQEIQAADYSLAATRVESRIPAGYRLICVSGELKLQGLFTWTQGRDSGREWRTLETQCVETELTLDEFTPF